VFVFLVRLAPFVAATVVASVAVTAVAMLMFPILVVLLFAAASAGVVRMARRVFFSHWRSLGQLVLQKRVLL
jgi:hypothetical protein